MTQIDAVRIIDDKTYRFPKNARRLSGWKIAEVDVSGPELREPMTGFVAFRPDARDPEHVRSYRELQQSIHGGAIYGSRDGAERAVPRMSREMYEQRNKGKR